jgi:hypothetical protein
MRFPFVQFEFPHALGPPEGRYLVRDPHHVQDGEALAGWSDAVAVNGATLGIDPALLATTDVLLISVRGAPPARPRLRRRRAVMAVEGESPAEVSMIVATAIKSTRMLDDLASGEQLIASLTAPAAQRTDWVGEGLAIVNRAIRAYRLCAVDPYAMEVAVTDAHVARVGYGTGAHVFNGQWERAMVMPPPPAPKVSREALLLPQQGMAAMLAGRAPELECEELLLRAGLDLDQGRLRGAALGLGAGLALLRAELAGQALLPMLGRRLETAADHQREVDAMRERALAGELRPQQDGERLRELLTAVGAVVDVWRYEVEA